MPSCPREPRRAFGRSDRQSRPISPHERGVPMSNTQQFTDVPVEPSPGKEGRRLPRWVLYVGLGLIAAVVLFFGAIFLYAKVINDSPDAFDSNDLNAALSSDAGGSTQATVATGQPPVPSAAPGSTPASTAPASAA